MNNQTHTGLRGWLSGNTQLVIWLLAFPLALTLFAWWEHREFQPPPEPGRDLALENRAEIEELEALLARLQREPRATLDVNGKKYGNPLASQMVSDEIAELKGERRAAVPEVVERLVRPATTVALAASAVAMALGLLGLLMAHLAAWRAMRSRDALMHAFKLWVACLPRYLAVLMLVQLAAVGALAVVRGYVAYAAENASRGEMKMNLYLLLLALALVASVLVTLWRLRGSLHMLDAQPSTVLGRAVGVREAPGLWRHVAELARRLGASVPKNIVVGVVDSFYVTAHDIVLHPSGERLTGETMYLPLTYLSVLRQDEVDAIVAHELGHFAGEDTRYSLGFAPLYRGMAQRLQAIQGEREPGKGWGSPLAIAFTAYLLQCFSDAVMHWSRVREFAADQAGARVAGTQASARALVRMTSLDAAVGDILAEVARRPDEAGHDLLDMLNRALQARSLAVPDFSQEVATSHPSDTHPPTLERLKALGQPLGEPLLQAALAPVDGSALLWVRSLFADGHALQSALLSDFKAQARERNLEFREHLASVAGKATAPVDVFDKHGTLWVFLTLGVFCLFVAAVLGSAALFWGMADTYIGGTLAVAGLMAAGAAALFVLSFMAWRRSRALLMRLSPSGLGVPGLEREIGWGEIEDYSVTVAHGAIVLLFDLSRQTPELRLLHRNHRRVKYLKDRHQLSIGMFGARGMENQDFYDLLHSYVAGWHARRQLQEM